MTDLSSLITPGLSWITMRLLDRYVIRNFLQIYLYCIVGFISIWLIFDVSDNISTFIDEHVGILLVIRYYASQLPQVFIILLPVSLLLSLLFALGRMSRANEIVSMLTAGVSLPRVLLPLIGMGLLTVAASMALNYSLAPLVHSEFPSAQQYLQQRAGASTGRQRQHRYKLRRKPGHLQPGDKNLGIGERESRSLRPRRKHHRRADLSFAEDRALERNTIPPGQRK